MYKRDLCQVGKEWLKGRITEGVVDADGNVVAVCAKNAEMADLIVALLNGDHPDRVEANKLRYENTSLSGKLGGARHGLNCAKDSRDRWKERCQVLEAILKVEERGLSVVLPMAD